MNPLEIEFISITGTFRLTKKELCRWLNVLVPAIDQRHKTIQFRLQATQKLKEFTDILPTQGLYFNSFHDKKRDKPSTLLLE